MMDSDPECYAWGLGDLRSVKHPPYDFELLDYNPVFKRQYHLARKEQEWADDWVKKLEDAGIVRESRSPYAAPVVVALILLRAEDGAQESGRVVRDCGQGRGARRGVR